MTTRLSSWLLGAWGIGLLMAPATFASDRDLPPNGYTYVAPSYYLTPPVMAVPVAPYPPPVVMVYEPAFLHTTVVPYDPVWPYAYVGLPGMYYRERVTVRPHRIDYRLRSYGPRVYRD